MGTNCTIARSNSDCSIDAIYVHYDGYLSGVGKHLLSHYNDHSSISILLNSGDCSSIFPTVESFDSNSSFTSYSNLDFFLTSVNTEFIYLYVKNSWISFDFISNKFISLPKRIFLDA
jgi:hypothetical protein